MTSYLFRLQILGCPTSTTVMNIFRRFVAALYTRPQRSSMDGRTVGPRSTPGPLVCCCTHWFMAPCHLMGLTTKSWSSRLAQGTTGNQANHLVHLMLFIWMCNLISKPNLSTRSIMFSFFCSHRCLWTHSLDAHGESRAQSYN